jgi:hypothetical protein
MSDPMRPHPGGLPGRVQDALDDLALLKQEHATPEAVRWAQTKADALVAALAADTDTGNC